MTEWGTQCPATYLTVEATQAVCFTGGPHIVALGGEACSV